MFTKKQVPRDLSFSETPNLEHLMEILLKEQRHQRADLASIRRQLHTIINSNELQTQVDEFYDQYEKEHDPPGEARPGSGTSPQTDTDEQ